MDIKQQLDIKVIQKTQTKLLKHFSQYCQENNITFFLSNGTLLGAVKYRGFIPWDDDTDVLVPRDDYDRLLREYKDSTQYVLYSPDRNKVYR